MDSLRAPRASALDRINRLPITSYYRKLAWILGFVFFFDHADINTLAFAAPGIVKFWGISLTTVATLVSATFAGMFVGASVGGWLADRIGRKRALLYTTIWYTSFSLLNALAWSPASLFATRLLTGIGISAMTVVGITYITEIFPARVRGACQGWVMLIGLCGVPLTAYIARFCIPLAPWGWRLVFVWGAVGILFPLFSGSLEESPRWYENHGRFDEADAALDRIEDRVRREAGELPNVVHTAQEPRQHGRYADLFAHAYLPRTVLLVSAWVFMTLGFFGFTSWVPTLLLAQGFSLVHSLAWSSAMSLATIPGALLAALLSDKWERKWLISIASIVIAACGLLYGSTFKIASILVFGLLVEMFIHMFSPLMYTYTAESFPSRIRNSGTGLAYGAGRLANVFGPLLVAWLYHRHGYTSVFIYIATSWVMVGILVAAFGLRSRRLV
ncbi:MAG TPA: MFS transporter [Acidobacteriaceae bacterium]|jgi:putative MFS transporter